jgi:hypothetical protein
MWRVRQQLPPADLISVNETLELLNCKILRVNKWHTIRPLQLQTPCSTRCVASFLHLCQTQLILQTAVRIAYNKISHCTNWDERAFGTSAIKKAFIRKRFHKSIAQVQNPVIWSIPGVHVQPKSTKSLCPPWSDTIFFLSIPIRPKR